MSSTMSSTVSDSGQQLHPIFMQSPVATMLLTGPQLIISLANQKALELCDRAEDHVLHKPIFEALPELKFQGFEEILQNVFNNGQPFHSNETPVKLYRHGKLSDAYINFVFEPFRDQQGNITGVIGIGTDVTPQVEARKKLEENESRFSSLIEQSPVGIGLLQGPEMVLTMANASLLKSWGKGKEIIGTTISLSIPGLNEQPFYQALQYVFESGECYQAQEHSLTLIKDQTKQECFFNLTFQALKDENGNVFGISIISNDITAQVHAFKTSSQNEVRFRHMLQNAPVAITVFRGLDLHVEMANRQYLEIVDRTAENFIGKKLLDALPELQGQGIRELLIDVLLSRQPFYGSEYPVELFRNGRREKCYFNFVYYPIEKLETEESAVMVVANDITEQVAARHKIEGSELRFRSMVMQSPIAMAIFSGKDFIIELANETLLRDIWEKTLEEVEGRKLLDVFPELEEQPFPRYLAEVMETGVAYGEKEATAFIGGKDGLRKFYLDFNYSPLVDINNKVYGIIVTVNNITEKVESRKKLEELEQRSRLAIEAAEMGTFDWDLRSQVILSSPRLLEIFGFSGKTQITHKELLAAIHEADRPLRNQQVENAATKGTLKYEARVVWPDRSIHWIKVNGKMLFDDGNAPLRMYGTVIDVTEYKNALLALADSEDKLRIAINAADLGTYDLDIVNDKILFSKRLAEIYGYKDIEELPHDSLRNLIHPADRSIMEKANREALKTGLLDYEARLLWKDNSLHWVRAKGKVLFNEKKQPVRMLGTAMDITDEKNALNKLEVSEARLRLATESAELGTFDLSLNSDEVLYSPRYLQIFGYNETREWSKKIFLEHVHPEDQHLVISARENAVKSGKLVYEVRIIWQDGSIHWIKKNGNLIYSDKGEPERILGTLMDITEQKKTKQELEDKIAERTLELRTKNLQLQQQKDFVDIILDSSVDNIAVFDKEHRYLTVNRRFEEMYKISKKDLIGEKITDLFPEMKDSEFEQVLEKAFETNAAQNLKHQSPITGKFYDTFFIPLHYNDQLNAVLAIAHDNTHIIEASERLKKVNNTLLEKNRELEWTNNELEQFAYIASHDLQEPLRKIRTYSGILHETLQTAIDDASKTTLQKIMKSAERMSNLIYDLLNFSRLLNPEKAFVDTDLNVVIGNVIHDFELTIDQKKATINLQELPTIQAAPLQMNQLFYNLINNSLKFSREDTAPLITVKCQLLAASKIGEIKNLRRGLSYYDICISDNGIGFDPQYSEHIFEVFKRLQNKAAYPGSGIGLALCRKIALNHKGYIYGEGNEGVGSVFHVLLPAQHSPSNLGKNQ